jgi:release factor glutamine methyltransferase
VSSSPENTYEALLGEVKASLTPLPDKPEETAEGVLNALWFTAAGMPSSVERAKGKPLPELNSESHTRLRQLLDKRISGVPLAHLTERQNFFGVELIAGPGALIPRKETEIVGRAALAKLQSLVAERGQALVLDACTGSGNLALALAFSEPRCRVLGADLSQEAVDLADRNLQFTGLADRVEFRQGDLLEPFESPEFLGNVDLLTCNPPYMSSGKLPKLAREISAFEPELAFNGGPFGINILTKLIRQAPRFLKPASWLCFEVGLGQGPALARQLQNSEAFSLVETNLDEAGEIRAMSVRTKS